LVRPYNHNRTIRKFYRILNRKSLVWHKDREERKIVIIRGQGWRLQMNNNFPFLLEEGCEYFIPKMVYHRLIKGKTNLTIKIL